ncbi:FkbM family methyltransferase [Aquabacter sp. L1I39]|uniref:FkbM family methyltransferase n=1 Tax=Aquabacter sp. L1I39 TaxID=2820278 RepID=UPI001AD99902|nr:FkbM family methyltransferase [Aquabacter sp. L1I39]QTL03856.1 FkbM family methyltransferase [Aquabacter sp. L1I39]
MREERQATVRIGDKDYQIVSDDDYLAYVEHGFEPDTVLLLKALLREGDTVLDVGANIGCTALLFSETAGAVHAFEPSPTTWSYLSRNTAQASHANVEAHNFGLGAEAGETTLTFSPNNRSGGFVSDQTKAAAGHTTETIRIRTLDEVVPELGIGRVDLIKIDVEGFEGHVLRGAGQVLANHSPLVTAELNHWCLNAFQRVSIPDFFDQLRTTFPIVLAVDGGTYLDLNDDSERYTVMYHHILHMRFPNVVGAYDEAQLAQLRATLTHGFAG